MNFFVYRDTFFELERVVDSFVLHSEVKANVHRWDYGTSPSLADLRIAADRHVEERISNAYRAAGDCECPACGEPYRQHPAFRGAFFCEHAYLTRLCTGELVKL